MHSKNIQSRDTFKISWHKVIPCTQSQKETNVITEDSTEVKPEMRTIQVLLIKPAVKSLD